MMAIGNRENVMAGALGGAMILGVGGLLFASHYQAVLHPKTAAKDLAASATANGLNIPTIDEMCKTVGATTANMAACRNEESQAAEFVVAWMGLNGFITNGAIDAGQIQLAAELGSSGTSPLSGPDPTLDPSGGDAADGEPNIDPATGEVVDQTFDSPGEIAMYCMSNSMDWLQMHDCISRYDPSTRFTGQ